MNDLYSMRLFINQLVHTFNTGKIDVFAEKNWKKVDGVAAGAE